MPQTLVKRPGESRQYAFDFGDHPEVAGGQTLTGSPTVTASQDGLTIGSPSVSGETVVVVISGGTSGQTYNLSCTVATSGGRTLACVGTLKVTTYGG